MMTWCTPIMRMCTLAFLVWLCTADNAASSSHKFSAGQVTRHLVTDSIAAELARSLTAAVNSADSSPSQHSSRVLLLACSNPFWRLPEFDSLTGNRVECFDSDCAQLEQALASPDNPKLLQRGWSFGCGTYTAGSIDAAGTYDDDQSAHASTLHDWWSQRAAQQQDSSHKHSRRFRGMSNSGGKKQQHVRFNAVVVPSGRGQLGLSQLHALTALPSLPGAVIAVEVGEDDADAVRMMTKFDRLHGEQHVYHLATNSFNATFGNIYEHKLWSDEGAGSGWGSSLESSARLRQELVPLLAKYGIKSMLDSSCGGMLWMPLVLEEAKLERFLGADVVCSLVEQHKRTFESKKPHGWDFVCLDASNQPMPSGYDLVFSRDSLQHLPLQAARMFLHNVRNSGAKYLLVGSYLTGGAMITAGRNVDVPGGGMYDINLRAPPFNLRPEPLQVIEEGTGDRKFMLLYDVETMQWDEDLDVKTT